MRTIKGYVSSRAGKRLEDTAEEIRFEYGRHVENQVINLFPERRYQEILGFGGAGERAYKE